MKTKIFYFLLILILLDIYQLSAQSQVPYLVYGNEEYKATRQYFEEIANNSRDIKGQRQNWAKRWLWLNDPAVNPSMEFLLKGNEFNPGINEYKPRTNRILSESSWVPVGPEVLPPTYDSRSCYGLGRINCIAFHPTDSNIIYIGTPGGGVWKTENHGKSWSPLTDFLPTLSVSSIAVDPKNPDNVYFASGDVDAGSISDANAQGVFRSSDGGASWIKTTLAQVKGFNNSLLRSIIVNKDNPDLLLAGGRRGIWKSTDKGDTWIQVLDSLITDMEVSPRNSDLIFAGMAHIGANNGSAGILKSRDFGDNWVVLNAGMEPKNEIVRVDIAISPANTYYIYALAVSAGSHWGGLHSLRLSTDGGDTWTVKADYNTSSNFLGAFNGDSTDPSGQGTYDLALLADPYDKDKVYAGGVNLWMSSNAGKDWDIAGFWIYVFGKSIHADHHYAAYNPLDKKFYWCNDGGVMRTSKIEAGSKKWITDWIDRYNEDIKPGAPDYKFPTVWENIADGLAITEFYRLSANKNLPGNVSGGTQDNSCFIIKSGNWLNYIPNYDGMETMIDYSNPDVFYGVWQNGGLCKTSDGGKSLKYRLTDSITSKLGERGNWITPVAMDPKNPNTIYAGYRNLWSSSDGGSRWSKAFNLDSFKTDTSNNNSLSQVETSYSDSKYLSVYKQAAWTYSNSRKIWYRVPGELWITNDQCKSWIKAGNNLPIDSLDVAAIEYDYYNPLIMWVISPGSSYAQFNTFKTSDGGVTWIDVSKKLPGGIYLKCLVHQPKSFTNTLYAGTNKGVYMTDDSLKSWVPFNENMPNCIVSDIEIQDESGEIYVSTYGRGVWKTNILPDAVNDDSDLKAVISVFPNPSNGTFNLEIEEGLLANASTATMKISDIRGISVHSEPLSLNSMGAINKSFKLNLATGTYFIKIEMNGKSYSTKLLINSRE